MHEKKNTKTSKSPENVSPKIGLVAKLVLKHIKLDFRKCETQDTRILCNNLVNPLSKLASRTTLVEHRHLVRR